MRRSIMLRYKAITLRNKPRPMKKTSILLLILFSFTTLTFSQIELAIKGGIHTVKMPEDIVSNGSDRISFAESKFGYHFGVHPRLAVLGIFIEPGLTFNSSSVDYLLDDETTGNILNETYKDIGVPVVVGFGSGFISAFGGPVLHYQIDKFNDIWSKENLEQATMGFQAGVGVKLWKLRGEVRYEGNLSRFGDSVEIADHEVSFGRRASRIMFTVGIIL